MCWLPAHASPFEPRLHHDFVPALDDAGANGPPSGSIGGILHERFPLLQVMQMLLTCFQRGQGTESLQHACWPLMGEIVAVLLHPLGRQRMPVLFIGFGDHPKALSGVGKIEDAHRIRSMEIDEPLEPFGSISDGTDLLCLDDPSSLGLHFGKLGNVAASVMREK